ncbi:MULTISPECIES: hypothetical protein [Reichenbachiella]|uniref:Uncharacterized protein n=1 Tax=Reichenbachiella agariperforans TaxID=156994 RepID=A0A1M6SR01_REIAG|nr:MULTISPECIES: hypothetical protein [Reichenbachiella]MBU2916233.1 hypothetical protein [Reichenbachiella agariperforans]RJE75085.1 hypothetical protein BGP76_18405 [Reichenbachiella sp. MSK19-1]SHK47070.1 hypothetical protein SAMN04488028_105114 [Reichenbachiella agariperforans]
MEKTKIISVVFLVIALGIAYYLGSSIYTSITETERIENMENRVINKLSMIREAQIAYQTVNGNYTSDWGKLKSFVDSGEFYLISKIEHIITLDYGADSVYVELDTLGTVSVKDSLFSAKKYPKFNLETLSKIPGTKDAEFGMWADEIEKGGVKVDVVEVWDTAPTNPARNEKNEARTRKPLRFGSRTNITTAGNWE